MPRIDSMPVARPMMSWGASHAAQAMSKTQAIDMRWDADTYERVDNLRRIRASASTHMPVWYGDFKQDIAREISELIDAKAGAKKVYTVGKFTKAGFQSADVLASAHEAGQALANSPELAKKVAEAVKAGGQWHGAIHVLGDTLLVLKVGIAGYSVHTAPVNEKVKTVSSESGNILGSIGGGFLGGAFGKYTGAGVGALVAGPVGGVVGAALGVIGFGLVGSFAGGAGGGVVGKELYAAIDEFINKPPVPTFERIRLYLGD